MHLSLSGISNICPLIDILDFHAILYDKFRFYNEKNDTHSRLYRLIFEGLYRLIKPLRIHKDLT